MPSKTFIYKTDARAGDLPAEVFWNTENQNGSDIARPVVVIFHAGGFAAGSTALIGRSKITALQKLGFVVVTPEFRLSPPVPLHDSAYADGIDVLRWARTTLPGLLDSETAGAITINPARLAVIGHSAGGTLAAWLGGLPANEAPKAIAVWASSFYLADPAFRTPVAFMQALPEQDPAFIAKVYDADTPVQLTSPPIFTPDGKPDFSQPRLAWMLMAMKHGNQMDDVIGDGDIDRVEPARQWEKKGAEFPPIYVFHGTVDRFVPVRVAQKAVAELKERGVEVEGRIVEGVDHYFGAGVQSVEDSMFKEHIQPGLDWLAAHV